MESLIESLIDGSLLNELCKIYSSWENATVADTPQPSVPTRKSEPCHRQVLRIQICQIWYPAIPMTRREDVLTSHAVSLSLFLSFSPYVTPWATPYCSLHVSLRWPRQRAAPRVSRCLQVSPKIGGRKQRGTAETADIHRQSTTANDSSSQSANHPASPLSITPAKMNSRLTAN